MGFIKDSREIGAKIRDRRKAVGITQEGLGELLGVSYQQVQKYEKGSNRLSPERLQQVAGALAVPIGFFFGQEEGAKTTEARVATLHAARFGRAETRQEQELLRRFRSLRSSAHRTLVLSLLHALARHREP